MSTPEKSHIVSEDCEDQGVIPKYTSRKSPPILGNPNPKQFKSKQTSDEEPIVRTKQSSSSAATHKKSSLQEQGTWTVNGQSYVFDEKVKTSVLFASLQFEMQLDNAIQIAYKCLTGYLELGTREMLCKDDREGRVIIFSGDQKPGRHYNYCFNMFLVEKPCPHSVHTLTHPNFQAEITLCSGDTLLETWELNLYHVRSVSQKSKVFRDSITNIELAIVSHIKALINRVIIFIKTLVLLKSKLSSSSIDEDCSIRFSNVKRMVYEHGGDKNRKVVVQFLVEQFEGLWQHNPKSNCFARKNSAVFLIPMI
jgi:hypothetical protein